MALVRGGKRFGSFDIRGGISRGDYKSSAYHKTDTDPRLRMQNNEDNTIGRFRSAINAAEGFARPSRFAVRFYPPSKLEDITKAAGSSVYLNGEVQTSGDLSGYNGADAGYALNNPTSKFMNDLTSTYGRQVNINCDTISMPSKDLQTQEIQYGSEPTRSMVQTHAYQGLIQASFYADKYMRERQFFEMWQKMCVGETSHKANYYDSYIGKMQIFQLGSNFVDDPNSPVTDRDMPTYAIEAMEVYPATLGAVEYGYGKTNEIVKINVGFAYKHWRNMSTTTGSRSFGRHMQSPADVKRGSNGLFDSLPPELGRIGRSVFSQARTVLNPIGRLSKGRIFLPFT